MEPPTGLYGVSADLFGLPHAESFTGLDQAPTPPPSGTIRSMQCASWGPQGALRGTNGVSAEIVVTLGCEICYWLQPGTQNSSTREKRCRLCASWSPWGHLSGHMGHDMGRFHGTLRFRISIGLYKFCFFGPLTGFSACSCNRFYVWTGFYYINLGGP